MKGHLILLRGLPGCGKTTLANLLSENGKYPVLSVDDFFTDASTGNYNFEFDKNHIAYKTCEQNTLAKVKAGVEKIFIANTFTHQWEMQPYIDIANKHQYMLFVITVENRHGSKSIHNITEVQMMKMKEKYQVVLM